jgi:thymidylate kinase
VATDDVQGALITGPYGSGKTTAMEDMAAVLEGAGVPYAAVDLDWLAWANVDDHGPASHRLLLRNLQAVVANDRDAGMTRFLFAGTVTTEDHVADLARAAGMSLRVVRLAAPIEVIVQRLQAGATDERLEDLEQARTDIREGRGAQLGDLVVNSDRPVRDVATEILDWLEWLPPARG